MTVRSMLDLIKDELNLIIQTSSQNALGLDAQGQPLIQVKDPLNWLKTADGIFSMLAGGDQIHIINPHACCFFLLALLLNELTE